MTEQDLSQLLGKPFEEILRLSHYREILQAMFDVVYHKGQQQGLKDAHDDLNQSFKSYETVSILN